MNLFHFVNKKFKYVFYVENEFYKNYLYDLIIALAEKDEILYLTSDNHKINEKNIINYNVGNGFLRFLIFQLIKADSFFLTTTDLGNNVLKKNKFVKRYVYIFHAAVSVHKNYTKNAFDNYDEIFCIGDYQINQFEKMFSYEKYQKIKFVKTGYMYFEHLLKKKLNYQIKKNKNKNILIAPSWNYSDQNFLVNYSIELFFNILKKKELTLTFRPHPEHYKRNSKILDIIKERYSSNNNFVIDNSKDPFLSCQNSDILISDHSGILIEYGMVFQKPMLFFDKYEKIHNSDHLLKNIPCINDVIKENLGVSIKEPEFEKISTYIDLAEKKFSENKKDIDLLISNNFYNFKTSIYFTKNYILSSN